MTPDPGPVPAPALDLRERVDDAHSRLRQYPPTHMADVKAILDDLLAEVERLRAVPSEAVWDFTRLDMDAVAKSFHDHYERLAPKYGYETREASANPWDQVPDNNRALMVDTIKYVMADLSPTRTARSAELEARLNTLVRHRQEMGDLITRLTAERDALRNGQVPGAAVAAWESLLNDAERERDEARAEAKELTGRLRVAHKATDDIEEQLGIVRAQRRALGDETERRRVQLRDARNELLTIRGVLSPQGEPDVTPVSLVPSVVPAIEWLGAEVERLRAGRAALDATPPWEDPDTERPRLLAENAHLAAEYEALKAEAQEEISDLHRSYGGDIKRLRRKLKRAKAERAASIEALLAEIDRLGAAYAALLDGQTPTASVAAWTALGRATAPEVALGPVGTVMLAQADQAEAGHHYLSTGCYHGHHDYCGLLHGVNGEKRPATCKWCPAKCECSCHQLPLVPGLTMCGCGRGPVVDGGAVCAACHEEIVADKAAERREDR